MKKKKEVKVPKSRQLLSMAIELAAQSERLVLLNEVGCVDDVIQAVQFVGQYQKFTMCMSMDIITSCSAPRTPYITVPANGFRINIRLV